MARTRSANQPLPLLRSPSVHSVRGGHRTRWIDVIPVASSETDVREAIGELATQDHDFGPWCWTRRIGWKPDHQSIAAEHNAPTIDGSGERGVLWLRQGLYDGRLRWRELLKASIRCATAQHDGCDSVALKVQRSMINDRKYDRYMPDLHRRHDAAVRWADVIGFMALRTASRKPMLDSIRRYHEEIIRRDRWVSRRPELCRGNRYGHRKPSIPRTGGGRYCKTTSQRRCHLDGWQSLQPTHESSGIGNM